MVQGIHRFKGTDYSGSLTIRHLIGQTSGLRDYFLDKPKGGKSLFERLLLFPPSSPFDARTERRHRTRAHYSDTNYKLLGAIIESVTEEPLHKTFKAFFFDPLELRQTYIYGQPNEGNSIPMAPTFYKGRALLLDKMLGSTGPEGGLVSTVHDTIRFGKAVMRGELFRDPKTLQSMQHWHSIFFPFQYGYGLMRFHVPRFLSPFQYSPELVGHSGSTGSFLYYCKDLDLYMAGTINEFALRSAPFRLMLKVADMFRRLRS